MKRIFIFILTLSLCAFSVGARAEITIEDAFSPSQGATDLIVKTIDGAHTTIRVAAYGFTSKPIAEALIAAHRRGVDVEAVLDMKANRRYGMSWFLAENGIPVRPNGRYAILHDKFMIVDDEKLELGSFNYTKSAEIRNAENVLVIAGQKNIVRDYANQWNRLWSEGETLSD
jgi:phosphatidylserine/phosphatidylglycerophosphate/cardiolipin synthase-like enzyme